MKIPLIFVHRNNKYYLKPVLKQAYWFNKDADIYLLGDKKNDKYNFLKHYQIDDYSHLANEFKEIYQHLSTNGYDYELFCFQRWFVIREFVEKHDIERFLCLDSDVLLYCNVMQTFSKYTDSDFTIVDNHCPCYTMFTQKGLARFCDFITKLYTNPIFLDRLKRNYDNVLAANLKGGNSDMTAFDLYQEYESPTVKELSTVENSETFDIAMYECCEYKRDEDNKKSITWKNDKPYGIRKSTREEVLFKALHFQGDSKLYIYDFIVNNRLKRPLLFRLKTYLSPDAIRTRIRRRKLKRNKN